MVAQSGHEQSNEISLGDGNSPLPLKVTISITLFDMAPRSSSTMRVGTRSFSRNEDTLPKPSRWTAEKRYEIVLEMLRGKESIAQIARNHMVSDAVLHRWRERFFEGGKAAL